MTEYQNFIALSRYARWLPDDNRRETWEETVGRYISFFKERVDISEEIEHELHGAIQNLEVMPSMRSLMTAGEALERDNVAGFNCAYLAINRMRAFDELMYILMCGTGVGFSCERAEVLKLPILSEEMHPTDTTIVVGDSKVGWASAFREVLSLLWAGKIPKWDVTKVRAAGKPLKTFGGRASGPEPLVSLFKYSVDLFRNAAGRRLTTLLSLAGSVVLHSLALAVSVMIVLDTLSQVSGGNITLSLP
jgi:ribonucleoside-triphosphate reductase